MRVIAPLAPKDRDRAEARDHYAGDGERAALTDPITVDCLFGYGLTRAVEGQFADL